MTVSNDLDYKLSSSLYRSLLILTDFWSGTRISPESLIVKVHDGGDGVPFFWAGTPIDIVNLPNYIGQDRSIYCFSGTYGMSLPTEENIKMLAVYYKNEILKAWPSGPYLLGGHCTAALISYEIAKLLTNENREVKLLVITELDVPDKRLITRLFRRIYSLLENQYIWSRSFKENFIDASKSLVKKLISKKDNDISINRELYCFSGYSGHIHLIYVRWGLLGYFSFKFFQRYWRNLALGGADFHIIPGRVHTPDGVIVAKIIKKLIG
ncbi:MAG: thioesterase domain-containing protein [Methylococcales bacterium]|nr:thioesterase domain-containing protein [Methylococcales bacterium]MDD5631255.1 thioesterase domain-containing protein [Methylococcales bacterium]